MSTPSSPSHSPVPGAPRAERASAGTITFFGSGALAVGVKNAVFGSFVLLYYNQVLGLDPLMVSLALFCALLVDAVSDPLVGTWSDRVHSRLGRRHPFMYASILPFSISIFFLLQPPADLSQTQLLLYLVLVATAVRLSMTFYEVPRQALGPELTKDYEQRTFLFGIANAFGWIGAGATIAAAYGFLFPETEAYAGSRALLNPAGYELMAWIAAGAVFVTTTLSTVGLHGQIGRLYTPPETRRIDFRELLHEARETLANRSWLMIFFAGLAFALFIGLQSGTDQYYNVYFWEWVPAQLRLIPIIQMLAVLVCAVAASSLAKGRDKKKMAVGLFSATVVLGPLPVSLRLLSDYTGTLLLPPNGTDGLWWIILTHTVVMSCLAVVGFILIGSMVADIVEESQETTGRRSEGLLSAGPALVQKAVSGTGVLVLGIVLSVFGFTTANPTVESMREPMQNLALFHVILGITLPVISTYLVSRYTITREGHERRVRELGYVESEKAPAGGPLSPGPRN